MKLAEALIKRAELKTRSEQIRSRISASVKVQEGDEPADDVTELIRDYEDLAVEMLVLVRKINATNAATIFEAGNSLSDILAVRENLKLRHKLYVEMIDQSTIRQARFSRNEVKFRRTVDVKSIRKVADDLARTYRELDIRIQALNWVTELLE